MSDTPTSRAYAWAKQTNYATPKTLATGALKQIIVTDQNFVDYAPAIQDNEDWAHGANSATDQWLETHATSVQHTMPGFSQELGKVFDLNMGQYSVAAEAGGSVAKRHVFKPTDVAVTRQDKAVTYAEKTGAGWNVLVPAMVGDGFSLKGDGMGLLMCDFGLVGSGEIDFTSPVTWHPAATPTVGLLSGLHKLFNSQIGLIVDDGVSPITYGCRYRSFELAYRKTMLDDASMSPGCANFMTDDEPESGAIRSSYEFDKQMLDFTLEVDMTSGSPEAIAVQNQTPLEIEITATGGIIEAAIRHQLIATVPIGQYRTSKPVVSGGIMRFAITGKALFDFTNNRLFQIDLINDVATYASAF